eukprot:11711-Pyramimonas_sp.AAC.2
MLRTPAASSAPTGGASSTRRGEGRPPGLGGGRKEFGYVSGWTCGGSAVANRGSRAELLMELHDAASDFRRGLKADEPKLSAPSAAVLHGELRKFLLYMKGRELSDKVRWFTRALAVATDRAKTCIESCIVTHFGNDAGCQRAVDSGDGASWAGHWVGFER